MTKYLTIEQVMERLLVKRDTVYRLIKNGELPAINVATNSRPGRRMSFRVSQQGLTEFEESRRVRPLPPTEVRREPSHASSADVEPVKYRFRERSIPRPRTKSTRSR